MHTTPILQHLKKYGQQMDSEIAAATGIALPSVHASLQELADQGEISRCSVTRFHKGQPIVGIQCRVRGYAPPAAPGRKPGTPS
jgi:DNA-binding IclR family transcriptional regulator